MSIVSTLRRLPQGVCLAALLLIAAGCNQTGNPPPPDPGPVNPGPPGPQPPAPPPVGGGACATTLEVNSKVSVPTLWKNTAAACDLLVNGTVSVSSSLVIEPGTVVQFSQDATFYVETGGQLQAVGTPGARIAFIGAMDVKGYWNGLRFMAGSRASRLEFVDFKNAGQTGSERWKNFAAVVGNGLITFLNNRVSGSYAHGADFGDDLRLSAFANNVFEDNIGFGVIVGYNQVAKLDKASDYLGANKPNGNPYIYADWAGTDDFVEDGTWKALSAPYYINIALYVNGALTLEPGVKIVAEDGTSIRVRAGGSLTAVGTAAQPIIFTAKRPIRGAWSGIEFFESSSPSNRFAFAQILYAGGSGAAVEVSGAFRGSYLNVSNTQIAHSDGWAICTDDGMDTPTVLEQGTGNAFTDNARGVGACN
jgi:hypothetical protein